MVSTWSFDHVFDQTATTEEVYAEVGQGIVERGLQGFNATLFAYGQTASGKTHTLMGPDGLLERTAQKLFDHFEADREHAEYRCQVRAASADPGAELGLQRRERVCDSELAGWRHGHCVV